MPNVVNQMLMRQLQGELQDAEGMLFVSFGGLTVLESEELRNKLAERGVELRMVRNKLARRVLAERGFELPADALKGNVAMTWGSPEDAIAAAKVFTESEAKKAGKIELRAGVLEGRVLEPRDAVALASVPDKDTLRAQLLGVLSGPARKLVTVIQAPLASLARVVQAHVDAAGEATEAINDEAPASE
jgi:large subunit ribosomal protein L10